MDVGYSIHQVSGHPVQDKPSVNQHRNTGGTIAGFVADFHRCDRNELILTTVTEPTLEALDARIDAWLGRFNALPNPEHLN